MRNEIHHRTWSKTWRHRPLYEDAMTLRGNKPKIDNSQAARCVCRIHERIDKLGRYMGRLCPLALSSQSTIGARYSQNRQCEICMPRKVQKTHWHVFTRYLKDWLCVCTGGGNSQGRMVPQIRASVI